MKIHPINILSQSQYREYSRLRVKAAHAINRAIRENEKGRLIPQPKGTNMENKKPAKMDEYQLGQLVRTRHGIGRVIDIETSGEIVRRYQQYRYRVLIGGRSEATWYLHKQLRAA
jgi:hypothetical protein